ncbi:hypothetical protein PR048_017979 [Dryococelus australis]|uniref:Uncharacterized protein n=1 Tax=Dryococelus australis TaxID=614101 RepID=A0ABQ9HBL0_9NEOP|nr:hypothetical protein PR048_017979 [Dryococelus australis]
MGIRVLQRNSSAMSPAHAYLLCGAMRRREVFNSPNVTMSTRGRENGASPYGRETELSDDLAIVSREKGSSPWDQPGTVQKTSGTEDRHGTWEMMQVGWVWILICAVTKACPNTIYLLSTCQPVSTPRIQIQKSSDEVQMICPLFPTRLLPMCQRLVIVQSQYEELKTLLLDLVKDNSSHSTYFRQIQKYMGSCFPPPPALSRHWDTGDNNTHALRPVAPTCKVLNRRAVLKSLRFTTLLTESSECSLEKQAATIVHRRPWRSSVPAEKRFQVAPPVQSRLASLFRAAGRAVRAQCETLVGPHTSPYACIRSGERCQAQISAVIEYLSRAVASLDPPAFPGTCRRAGAPGATHVSLTQRLLSPSGSITSTPRRTHTLQRSPRKPADQRHRPARIPHEKIRSVTRPGIEPGSPQSEASRLTDKLDFKHEYISVMLVIGSYFIRHALVNSGTITGLQEYKFQTLCHLDRGETG